MLCLTRKTGESILIADNIIVTVVEIERGRVKLGITAPKSIGILREELDVRRYPPEQFKHEPQADTQVIPADSLVRYLPVGEGDDAA